MAGIVPAGLTQRLAQSLVETENFRRELIDSLLTPLTDCSNRELFMTQRLVQKASTSLLLNLYEQSKFFSELVSFLTKKTTAQDPEDFNEFNVLFEKFQYLNDEYQLTCGVRQRLIERCHRLQPALKKA
jgi:hypothetical protein